MFISVIFDHLEIKWSRTGRQLFCFQYVTSISEASIAVPALSSCWEESVYSVLLRVCRDSAHITLLLSHWQESNHMMYLLYRPGDTGFNSVWMAVCLEVIQVHTQHPYKLI